MAGLALFVAAMVIADAAVVGALMYVLVKVTQVTDEWNQL